MAIEVAFISMNIEGSIWERNCETAPQVKVSRKGHITIEETVGFLIACTRATKKIKLSEHLPIQYGKIFVRIFTNKLW